MFAPLTESSDNEYRLYNIIGLKTGFNEKKCKNKFFNLINCNKKRIYVTAKINYFVFKKVIPNTTD